MLPQPVPHTPHTPRYMPEGGPQELRGGGGEEGVVPKTTLVYFGVLFLFCQLLLYVFCFRAKGRSTQPNKTLRSLLFCFPGNSFWFFLNPCWFQCLQTAKAKTRSLPRCSFTESGNYTNYDNALSFYGIQSS